MGSMRSSHGGTLVIATFCAAACFAAIAVFSRESSGLPDVLMDVALGGKMEINTANGPMLLTVGHHLQCSQCHSFTQKGLSQLADCPCKVSVGGVKDGQYYSGVITVSRTDKVVAAAPEEEAPDQEAAPPPPSGGGCRTKPMHLRVTAKGTFVGGLQVFAGDPRTESMLQQLLKFFGPNPRNGLVLDGTLTCRQEWDLEHPDYEIPKPGYPSDVAVKIPYGSTLLPLDDDAKLSPFETEIPESLAQRYGAGPGTARLRRGLEAAMKSRLFQRDAAANARAPPDASDDGGYSAAAAAASSSRGGLVRRRRRSMRGMLRELAAKVDKIADKTDRLDSTLGNVRRVVSWGPH